jgi:hypothetical protein
MHVREDCKGIWRGIVRPADGCAVCTGKLLKAKPPLVEFSLLLSIGWDKERPTFCVAQGVFALGQQFSNVNTDDMALLYDSSGESAASLCWVLFTSVDLDAAATKAPRPVTMDVDCIGSLLRNVHVWLAAALLDGPRVGCRRQPRIDGIVGVRVRLPRL